MKKSLVGLLAPWGLQGLWKTDPRAVPRPITDPHPHTRPCQTLSVLSAKGHERHLDKRNRAFMPLNECHIKRRCAITNTPFTLSVLWPFSMRMENWLWVREIWQYLTWIAYLLTKKCGNHLLILFQTVGLNICIHWAPKMTKININKMYKIIYAIMVLNK